MNQSKPFSPLAKYTYVTDKNRATIEQEIQQIALEYFQSVESSDPTYDEDLVEEEEGENDKVKTGIQLIISHKVDLRSFAWHHKYDSTLNVIAQG